MELRHLRYFVAVAEEGHFGRAADRLHISQPPLSQQIRQLEAELGLPLFRRTTRRVELTDAGGALLKEARRMLAQVEHAVEVVYRAGRGELGQLRLGYVGSAVFEALPSLLKGYRGRYPNVVVRLQEMSTDEQVRALLHDEIDLGLLRPPIPAQAVGLATYRREAILVVLPAEHSLAAQKVVPVELLADEVLLMLPRHTAPGFFDQLVGIFLRAGFTPRIGEAASGLHAAISMVTAGMGVTLVPATLRHWPFPGVAFRPLTGTTVTMDLALAWRGERPLELVAAVLDTCVGQAACGLDGSGSR